MLGRFSAVSTYTRQTGVFSPPIAVQKRLSGFDHPFFALFFSLFLTPHFCSPTQRTHKKNLFIFAQTECLQTCHPCPMCVNNHCMIHPLKRRRTFLSSQQHLQNNVTFDQLDGILIKHANGRHHLALSVALTLPTQTPSTLSM